MSDRAYTVGEIDALRGAVSNMWLYGSYSLQDRGFSRVYGEAEKTRCVEEIVRTHMVAGHTAEDLYATEQRSTPSGEVKP